jgi:hypothetical protein
LFLFFFS